MQVSGQWKVIITTGLALFAMFFGAGNIVFPLKIGVDSGQHLYPAIAAFIISGVGVPFLGLFAVSLYEGSYWQFFNRYGKVFAFLMVTFLILIIGPLFAAPRTEVVTYNTLLPLLPSFFKNQYCFDALYFLIVFMLIYKQSRIIEIIGWFLSPVKIIAFSLLIALGIYTASPLIAVPMTAATAFHDSFTTGYGTMDLLGTFFFCTIACKHIVNKCRDIGVVSHHTIIKMTLLSCILGAILIGSIYTGFIFIAASHASALQNVPTEALISKISYLILGEYGSLFLGICVSFACLATAAALTEVTTDYLHSTVLRKKIPRLVCLLIVISTMFMMAILGFDGIMKIAVPILNVVYPLLIVLCVVNIFLKVVPKRYYAFWSSRKEALEAN